MVTEAWLCMRGDGALIIALAGLTKNKLSKEGLYDCAKYVRTN
jgi:hypothetical protein